MTNGVYESVTWSGVGTRREEPSMTVYQTLQCASRQWQHEGPLRR